MLPDQWYDSNKNKYDSLTSAVKDFIQEFLNLEGRTKGYDYVFVESRLKGKDSFLRKMDKRKIDGTLKYDSPLSLTDITASRIVGYVLSDVEILSHLVERYFFVHNKKSVNKFNELGKDRVGLRSKNYIVEFRDEFIKGRPHLENYKEMLFEIQVKTLLDYTWSEIEHDRNYKTAVDLPPNSDIPRRFNILAGVLEMADKEFERLSKEPVNYAKLIPSKISNGDLDIEISTYSLREFLNMKFSDIPGFAPYFVHTNHKSILESFGITSLEQLNNIIRQDFKECYKKVLDKTRKKNDPITFSAILLDILIIHFEEKYFDKAMRSDDTIYLEGYHYSVFQGFGISLTLPTGWKYDC